jgi:hypothetical protein
MPKPDQAARVIASIHPDELAAVIANLTGRLNDPLPL